MKKTSNPQHNHHPTRHCVTLLIPYFVFFVVFAIACSFIPLMHDPEFYLYTQAVLFFYYYRGPPHDDLAPAL